MSFDKLVADLGELAKAMPAPMDKPMAAAGDKPADGAPELDADGKPVKKDAPEMMGKSFSFKLEDGTEIDATDGTELVKALLTRSEATDATLAKAIVDIQGVMGKQFDLIKSLTERVGELAGQGRGRKAVLSIHEKPAAGETPLAKSERDGMDGNEFMAKAEAMFKAQKITGSDLMQVETLLNKGMQIPAPLAAKVLG